MALKIYDKFSPRANVGDTNYPNGSIKNESVPGAKDGTPLDADWGNDYAGADAALFAEVGIVPNGDADTVLSSQRLTALQLLHIGDISKVFEFETIQDMKDSTIVFKPDKQLRVSSVDATYTVTSGTSPNIGSPALTSGLYAKLPLDNGKVYPRKWGLFSNNTNASTNNSILEAIKDYVISFPRGSRPSVHLPNGQIAYTVCPNWGYHGIVIKGDGPDFCQFKYAGSGRALNIDPSEFDLQYIYGNEYEGFLIDLGASGTDGVYMENIAHSSFKNVFTINGSSSAIHWNISLAVLCDFNTIGTPISRFAPSSVHSESIRLASSPSKHLPTTACTFTNVIGEGASSTGIRLLDADLCVFNGGTAESNTGRGVLVASTCRSNIFNGLDMEANDVSDYEDAGQGTEWNNCLATSDGGGIIGASSIMCKVNGGYYDSLSVNTGAKSAVVKEVSVNVKGTGGFTDAGTDTTKSKIYDKDAGEFINTVKNSRSSITVGGSPFTYKNETNQAQQILVRGGTVSTVFFKRAADTVEVGGAAEGGNVNNQFWLAPDDELVITYSVKPIVNYIPMGVQNL